MMNLNPISNPEKLLARIDYLEVDRRRIQNALEMALNLGDLQENIHKGGGSENILQKAQKRIRYLIPFEVDAFYLVEEATSNFFLSLCEPSQKIQWVDDQVEYMIAKGLFAWAVRERRGVTVSSRDHSRQFVLHVIATSSRIRGMFVGLLPEGNQSIPDASMMLLSVILLSTANALESLEFYRIMRNQNMILEQKVEERTRALADSERQLQEMMKLQAIGTLAGGIAHDFNNILFPIVGYTELTMDDVPADSQAKKNLEEVIKAASRAKELVQQILAFSRQNGREKKPLKVQYLIKEALKLLRATIPSSIAFNSNVDESCGPIMGDPTQIHQVIMNLCTNAYHAMQATGGILDVTLKEIDMGYEEIRARAGMKPGKHLQLTVKDTGHGMEPAVLERIYEPYFTTKEPGKGTGLGLAVIHGIVKNHGGDITVKSRPGEGTTFDVYLPVIEDVDVEPNAAEPRSSTRGKEHILLVDDEAQILDSEQQILERLGYKVTSKIDSTDALREFSANPDQFDLVITDMTMPKMTGNQLARHILEIKPNIPIILCTGFNETITEEKALSLGIDQFVMKPIVKDQLAHLIRTVLDKPKVTRN